MDRPGRAARGPLRTSRCEECPRIRTGAAAGPRRQGAGRWGDGHCLGNRFRVPGAGCRVPGSVPGSGFGSGFEVRGSASEQATAGVDGNLEPRTSNRTMNLGTEPGTRNPEPGTCSLDSDRLPSDLLPDDAGLQQGPFGFKDTFRVDSSKEVHERCDQAGPSRLVAGAEPRPVVSMEVLIEQDQVAPVRIVLELLRTAVDGPP